MITHSRMAALAVGTAAIALQTAPALADGTSAGTVITNTATVDYRVGGIDQNEETAVTTLTVDRKVNLVTTLVSAATTTVVPGQTGAVIEYEVTNLSNDTIDVVLAVAQAAGDNFDAGNLTIYVDNGNNVFDAGDAVSSLIDEIAADATVRVFVVGDIALDRNNGDVANLTLSAAAHAGATPGTQGAVLTTTPGPDTSGVETVLADGNGPDDSANDGIFTADGSYTVSAATLTVTKTNRVIDDPVNGTSDPKAIPAATVEYCIAVSNAAGSATATNIVITDVLPGDLTIVANSIRLDGTLDGSNNCLGGTPGGGYDTGTRTITAPLSDVAASETRTASFRATIN